MTSALIGYTGFVGGNLLRQHAFDDLYNSKNIERVAGRAYDLIVCAGAPAEKWKANQNPEADRATIERLLSALRQVKVQQFILISTIDVYPVPLDVDETSVIDWKQGAPYGRHRRLLEEGVSGQFPTLIARLPGIFGMGLKKNIIFDFLHNNRIDHIHADGQFQFYGLDHLWDDLEKAQADRLAVVNLVTEPVTAAEVAHAAFGLEFNNRPQGVTPAQYAVRSHYAARFGGEKGYLRSKKLVLSELKEFIAAQKELKSS